MSGDQFSTLRQSLPRLGRLLTKMRPTYTVESVADIDAEFLETHGIRAVLWDVDGSLMSYHGKEIDPAFRHVRTLFRNGPARHAILSTLGRSGRGSS